MQGKPTLIESLRVLAKSLSQRQSEWVEHHIVAPADHEALDAAVAMDEAATRLATYEAALRPLASLPIGPEIEDDHDLVIYKNAGRSITVGDILAARKALEDNT